ncbi:hypothetical protein ACFQBQ_18395 [Granulicella cerasi]|uniref:Uncharacterized protein n=1 Tax=Granulicella cerasi TaxID=741063 RepID=A0ABW1ZDL2_9BACT|nr:hypothetical protein [Granulicella cerasi]
MRFAPIEGTLLPVESTFDTTVTAHTTFRTFVVHLIGTDTYSNYRRFRSSAKIVDTTDLPAPEKHP